MSLWFFPVSKLTTKLIAARIKNTVKRVLPMSIETPAKPVAPKRIATKAKTKNKMAARNISPPEVNNARPYLSCCSKCLESVFSKSSANSEIEMSLGEMEHVAKKPGTMGQYYFFSWGISTPMLRLPHNEKEATWNIKEH